MIQGFSCPTKTLQGEDSQCEHYLTELFCWEKANQMPFSMMSHRALGRGSQADPAFRSPVNGQRHMLIPETSQEAPHATSGSTHPSRCPPTQPIQSRRLRPLTDTHSSPSCPSPWVLPRRGFFPDVGFCHFFDSDVISFLSEAHPHLLYSPSLCPLGLSLGSMLLVSMQILEKLFPEQQIQSRLTARTHRNEGI